MTSAYGVFTSPRVMLKLGQLYLQNGMAAADTPVVSADWVRESTTNTKPPFYVRRHLSESLAAVRTAGSVARASDIVRARRPQELLNRPGLAVQC